MANEIVLETMLVKLLGDGSSFQKAMLQSAQSAQQAAAGVEQVKRQIEETGNNLKQFASAAVSALAGYGLATSLTGAFEKFSELERNTLKMNAVLEFNKRDVEVTTKEYKKFADQIAETTTLSKGEVFGLLKKAETMGFTGDKAEQLAKASIGLGTASNMSAESAMRMVIALERGDTRALHRIEALRGIKDQTQLVAKANELMNLGWKEQEAISNTVSAQLDKLKRAFGGVTVEIGKTVADVMKPFVGIAKQGAEAFKNLSPEVKQNIVLIAGATLAFLGLAPALSTVSFLLEVLGLKFALATAKQTASIAVWLLWKTAVLAAQGVMALFNFQFAFWQALLGGSIFTTGAWSVAVLIAKAATWLWNAALAVLNVQLILFYALAAAGTVAVLAAGFAALTLAVFASWNTLEGLVEVMGNVEGLARPVQALIPLFMEWYTILKQIVRVAQVDVKAAWAIMTAGADLAVNQIKDLWPPLWEFIKVGFDAMTDYVTSRFTVEFEKSLLQLRIKFLEAINFQGALDDTIAGLKKDAEGINDILNRQIGRMDEALNKRLNDAVNKFGVKESDATKAARERLQEAWKVGDAAIAKAGEAGQSIGAGFNAGLKKELGKLDATLRFSAEAKARIAAFVDSITPGKGAGFVGGGSVPAVVGVLGQGGVGAPIGGPSIMTRSENLLEEIRDLLKAKKANPLQPADLGAGGDF